jgi:molybdate transport system ATP-binding protein
MRERSAPFLTFDLAVPVGGFRLEAAAELPDAAAVLGPSGAGKSTLLRALAGLEPRATGSIEIDSQSVWHLRPEARRLGYVPQRGALFPHLSVRRNLLFGASNDVDPDPIVETLELADLLERSPRHLSGGETRRVAVGRALLSRPKLLLLDEPTAGLDPERSRRLLTALRRVRRELGTALLVVTHRRDEALALADHVVLLARGRITASGPARAVLARAAGDGPPEESFLDAIVVEHRPDDGVTRVRLESGPLLSLPMSPELAPGTPVLAAVAADDVLVATGSAPTNLSARNSVPVTIETLEPTAVGWLLVAGPWRAMLTSQAVRELGLGPGDRVHLVTKTHSLRIVAG